MTATPADREPPAGSPAAFSPHAGPTPDTWVLEASGEIDVATSPELRRALHELADRDPSTLVLDLRDVTFIDSSGLGVLVGVLKRLREQDRDGVLVLEGLRGPVRKVFEITGLTDLFTIR